MNIPRFSIRPRFLALLALLAIPSLAPGQGVITNVRAAQRAGTNLVDIDYDVTGTPLPLKIFLEISVDDGTTDNIPSTSLSGAAAANVTPGSNLRLTWDAGKDWGGRFSTTMRYKVVADDASAVPAGFALIPTGSFQMGDQSSPLVGYSDELPVHTVQVSAFFMGKYEVTKEEWDAVRTWGLANGYRLPTEAEWEKAARGGVSGKNFQWGTDTITHSQANYYSSSSYAYDVSPTRGYHPTHAVGGSPYSSPVGSFAPNGYGLYDMAGNMWEWCWDWYGSYAAGSQTDPRGTTSGANRVVRGGYWGNGAPNCRAAGRGSRYQGGTAYDFGFRLVRSPVP